MYIMGAGPGLLGVWLRHWLLSLIVELMLLEKRRCSWIHTPISRALVLGQLMLGLVQYMLTYRIEPQRIGAPQVFVVYFIHSSPMQSFPQTLSCKAVDFLQIYHSPHGRKDTILVSVL